MTDERAKRIISILRTPRRAGPLERVQAARDAADELERLREEVSTKDFMHTQALMAKDAEIARLREALKPFAEEWEALVATGKSGEYGTSLVYTRDLKRAAEVLK